MALLHEARRDWVSTFLVCGPSQAGKSELIGRLSRRFSRVRRDGAGADIAFAPTAAPAICLQLRFVEIDPIDADRERAEHELAQGDGLLFVADARRPRLRENMVAFAWLLERLRAAGKSELPGVLFLNQRSDEGGDASATRLGPADLETAFSAVRFAFFEGSAMGEGTVEHATAELMRRSLSRSHAELGLATQGVPLHELLGELESALLGGECVAAPPEWERPLAFLRALVRQLAEERSKLSMPLAEAVAGAGEIVEHLDETLRAAAISSRHGDGPVSEREERLAAAGGGAAAAVRRSARPVG